jgi:hypothetical protein
MCWHISVDDRHTCKSWKFGWKCLWKLVKSIIKNHGKPWILVFLNVQEPCIVNGIIIMYLQSPGSIDFLEAKMWKFSQGLRKYWLTSTSSNPAPCSEWKMLWMENVFKLCFGYSSSTSNGLERTECQPILCKGQVWNESVQDELHSSDFYNESV